jgi:hypothetical protein
MKKVYSAPTVEQIPMDVQQSVMSTSGNTFSDFTGEDSNSLMDNTSAGAAYGTGSNSAASGSDLEDMINDILTY